MEIGIRGLIALAGALILAYVAWDAYRSRKRNQYKFKLEKNIPAEEPRRQDRDPLGFDLHGISQPRVRTVQELEADEREHRDGAETGATQASYNADNLDVTAADMFNDDAHIPTLNHIEPHFGDGQSAADDARFAAHEASTDSGLSADTLVPGSHGERAPQAQVEPDLGRTADLFGDVPVPAKPAREAARKPLKPARVATPKARADGAGVEVIAITVLGKNGRYFRGADLALAFMELDLLFGEHELFHRHADAAGTGEIAFSIANALKPGTFDPNRMEAINTPGLSLFMTVPGPSAPRAAYADLLATAEHLAQRLGGEVRDASRKHGVAEVRREHENIILAYEQRQQMLEV